jgi:SAM-dependent methyltransferase
MKPLSLPPVFAPPYSLFAAVYDHTVGEDFFAQLRAIFERLVDRYRIRFSSAADLGCGTGLFARYLNALWKVPVFGVDCSPAMLRMAANNCRDANVMLLRQDIRALRLPRPVDLVTANFDTLNHLVRDGDLAQVFRQVYAQLTPGGYFVFDVITPCRPPRGIRIFRGPASVAERIIQQIRWRTDRRMFFSRMIFRSPRRACRIELHRERAYAPEELAHWLRDAGFILRDVLDASTLRPARICAPRLIIVAQKPRR